jgi:uncharacterized membrane protein
MTISSKRVESFSDNVISIIITIMVFEMRFPVLMSHFTRANVWTGLAPILPRLVAYVFSFLVLGIMWVNHHHMFHLIQRVDEKLLWLNMHLLFWMSLIPFPTAMLGGNPFLPEASAMYGVTLMMTSIAFKIMRDYIAKHELMYKENDDDRNNEVDVINRRAKIKNMIGIAAYALSIPMAYVSVYISFACFIVLPSMFFIPDGVKTRFDKQTEGSLTAK